ncbi:MAG: TolC family protein [Desulfovermiculus sp.]|nr:TolC family protein [Desulfovermiculus sp.]
MPYLSLARNYFLPFLVVLIIGLAGHCPSGYATDSIWAPPQLEQLINEALENNRSIRSKAARTEALKTRIPAAAALPDPKVGFAVQSLPTDSFAFDQEPMTQKQVFVEQTVPWLSKLELRSDTVAGRAAEKKAELEAARLDLAREVAETWYELGYVAESQRINEEFIELMRRIRRDAESRYAVGGGQQQDIFQAEVELSGLQDEAIRLENLRKSIQHRLHELTNRERYQAIDPPSHLPEPEFRFSASALAEEALAQNPILKGLKAAINRARSETDLAVKDYYPDFNIRLSYGQREHDFNGRDLPDFISAAVAIDIPFWHKKKQSNELVAAKNDQRFAQNRYQDLKTRIPYKINSLISEIEDTGRRCRLYTQELIPQAGQWARSALDAYQVGKVEFDTMINARIRVLQFRQEASRLVYTAYQKRAELEALIGGDAAQKSREKSLHTPGGETDAER